MNKLYCKKCDTNFSNKEIEKLNCGHNYCIKCLDDYITENLNNKIKCLDDTCESNISDGIIRRIIDEVTIEKYEKMLAENNPDVYKCLLPECSYIHRFTNDDIQYACLFCSLFNCVQCKACHFTMTCDKYRSADDDIKGAICTIEFERARNIYKVKCAEMHRDSIIKVSNKVLIPNPKVFQCGMCLELVRKAEGVQLRNCFHCICRNCLIEHIKNNEQIPIPCPFECNFFLEEPEIHEVLEDIDKKTYNSKMLNSAFPKLHNVVQCQSPDCENMIETYGKVQIWKCSMCQSVNCLKCKAIHPGKTCKEYMKPGNKLDENTKLLIERKLLMECPKCKVLISKSGGCNWIKCVKCQTELCWILQTYRWGPKGHGDVSGGCKCGVGGKYCHVDCIGCIPAPTTVVQNRCSLS